LWGEKEHIGRKPRDCFYTPKPYPEVWKGVNSYFDDLFDQKARDYHRNS
jgi:hypothetical protein